MEISLLKTEEGQKLEDFFASVFGEELRDLAKAEITNALADAYHRHYFFRWS